MSASFDRRSRHLHERLPARGALDPACLPSVQEDVYGAARHTGLLVWISLFVGIQQVRDTAANWPGNRSYAAKMGRNRRKKAGF